MFVHHTKGKVKFCENTVAVATITVSVSVSVSGIRVHSVRDRITGFHTYCSIWKKHLNVVRAGNMFISSYYESVSSFAL